MEPRVARQDNILDFQNPDSERAWRSQVAISAEDSPDDAARALDLASATGADSGRVYDNLEDYDAHTKVAMSHQVVQSNGFLQQFVLSHPLAPKIANDDYGNLDKLSQSYTKITDNVSRPWYEVQAARLARGIREGGGKEIAAFGRLIGSENLAAQGERLVRSVDEEIPLSPADQSGMAAQIIGGIGQMIPALASALPLGIAGPALSFGLQSGEEQAKAAGDVGEQWQTPFVGGFTTGTLLNLVPLGIVTRPFQQAAPGLISWSASALKRALASGTAIAAVNEVGQLLNTELARWTYNPSARYSPDVSRMLANMVMGMSMGVGFDAIKAYVDAGEPVPSALHPILDKIMFEKTRVDNEALDQALKDAGTTNLSQRGEPGKRMLTAYLALHPDATVGFDGAKILDLYEGGTKKPEAGDGVFGWLPDIVDQLHRVATDGGDIRVPLSDYLARADEINPDVAKELKDFRRVDPNGLTLDDIKNMSAAQTEQQQQATDLTEEPATPRYYGGLTDSGVPVLDAVRRHSGLDQVAPAAQDFWAGVPGKNILPKLPLQDVGKKIIGGFTSKTAQVELVGRTTVADIMPNLDISKFPGEHRALAEFFSDRVNRLAGDTPVYIVKDGEWGKLFPPGYRRSLGYYDRVPDREGIYIAEEAFDGTHSDNELAHLMIHEAAHAATIKSLQAHPELQDNLINLMDETHEWFLKNEPEALSDPHFAYAFSWENGWEFVAQAWSDPATQKALMRAPISPELARTLALPEGKNTIWEAVKHLVHTAMEKLLGEKIPQNMFDGMMDWGDQLQRIREKEGGVDFEDVPVTPEEKRLFEDQKVLGYTKEHWQKVQKMLLEQRERDAEFTRKQVEAEATKRQTDAWKENEAATRPDAKDAIYQRPDIAADRFLRIGMLHGEKVTRRRLDGTKLTADQRKAIGEDYYIKKGGYDPDEVAPLFGYRTGDEMISELAGLKADRDREGLTPHAHIGRLVDGEVERRMKEKFGSLEQQIHSDAMDHVIGSGQFDLLHEDTLRIAEKAGIDKTPITKEQFKNAAIREFESLVSGGVKASQLVDQAGRIGRKIEAASTKGDWQEAFRLAQQRQITFYEAMEARDFEKLQSDFQKLAKKHVARELKAFSTTEAAAYHDWIQLFLDKVGMHVNRGPLELVNELNAKGWKDFQSFVDDADVRGQTIPAPDFLIDPNFRTELKRLTVGEAKSLFYTIKALDKFGKETRKANIRDDLLDLEPIWQNMYDEMERFPYVERKETKGLWDRIVSTERYYDASSRIIERLLNRFDRDNPRGPFNQYINRVLTEAANHKNTLDRKYGAQFRELGFPEDAKKSIPAPPMLKHWDGRPLTGFTNMNKLAIMLNMGNESNWTKFTQGRNLDGAGAQALWNWVMTHSTKEEWQWTQGVWNVFKGIKGELDTVYRRTTGTPPRDIEIRPVVTPHGTFDGGYYPLVKDGEEIGAGAKTALERMKTGPSYFRESIPNPHARERTGAVYPISMSLDHLPDRFYQMIHDIAYREPLANAKKILENKGLQQRIIDHYGKEYQHSIESFLRYLTNSGNFNSAAAAEGSRVSEFFRQNVMSFYVGANISTVLKHGPTALINSARQVGVGNLLKAYASLFRANDQTGESNWKFAYDNSEEIQRRSRDFAERFGGTYKDFTKSTLRDHIIQWGSRPVAFSDELSARPMWLAAFNKAASEGQSYGEARFEADRAVRYAHGSTAPTNLPEIARGGGIHAWFTSLYHFFGTMMQNRGEILFKLNDMYQLGREGELRRAAAVLPLVVADTMAYVVWPTAVEEYVTGLGRDDRRGWAQRIAWATVGGLANSAIYARDIVHALEYGVNEGGGMIDSAIHPLQQAVKDMEDAIGGKKKLYNARFAGNLIQDMINVTSPFVGTPREVGNLAKYGWNIMTDVEHPHTGILKDWYQWGDVGRGLTHGTQKMSVVKQ
jgi:hypothetical protein